MNRLSVISAIVAIGLIGCGYSSVNNEAVGQPKRIHQNTPMVCGRYTALDLSLGVMRNGVGSMSVHDITLYVPRGDDQAVLDQAIKDGKLVRVTYDEQRQQFCTEDYVLTHVDVIP